MIARILAALSLDPDDPAAFDALRRHLQRAGDQLLEKIEQLPAPAACAWRAVDGNLATVLRADHIWQAERWNAALAQHMARWARLGGGPPFPVPIPTAPLHAFCDSGRAISLHALGRCDPSPTGECSAPPALTPNRADLRLPCGGDGGARRLEIPHEGHHLPL